jgi:hypothetical protein
MDTGHFISLDISVIDVVTVRTRLLTHRRAYCAHRNGSIEIDELKMVLSTLLNSPHID